MQAIDIPKGVWRILPRTLTFSPDGRFLIMAAGPAQVLDTGAGRWLAPMSSSDHYVQFALGGRALVYCDYVRAVTVADFETRQGRRYELPQASARGLVVPVDGQTIFLLVYLNDEPVGSAVWRFDPATLEPRGQFARQNGQPWALAVSADGRRLATGRSVEDRAIRVWDTTDPERPAVAVTPKGSATQFSLSADGTRLAVAGGRGVTLWNADSARQVWTSGKHRRGVTMTCFCPTRPLLATGDNAGCIFLWDLTGRVLARYDFGLKHVDGLAFAPDGLRCAAAGPGTVVLWDIDV
jgi:WD40 repeat protein